MTKVKNIITYTRAKVGTFDAWHMFTFAVFFSLFVVGPEMQAFASQFNAVICRAVELVTTDAARAVATAAVVTIAIGALLGRVSWGMAVMIGVGIAALFAAPQIANFIGTGTWGADDGFCSSDAGV